MTAAQIRKMCEDLNHEFGEHLFNPFLRLKGIQLSIFSHVLFAEVHFFPLHRIQRTQGHPSRDFTCFFAGGGKVLVETSDGEVFREREGRDLG